MKEKKITRKEIILIYDLYKILILIQSSKMDKIENILKIEGINFQTFYKDIFHIFSLGEEKAKILFEQLDQNNNGFINWEEFLETIRFLMIRTKKGKANVFCRIADTDNNGYLSYEEVYYLSFISIKNNFFYSEQNLDKNLFIHDLVTYLTKYIFQICKIDIKDEIPISIIKNIIINDTKEANLFLFFCGADLD